MKPNTKDAYQLLHDGSLALSQVEANGICIDEDYLHKAIESTTKCIEDLTINIKNDKIYRKWHKHYGSKTNLESGTQLGHILFEIMDYECPQLTKTGRPKTDITVLETLKIPFVKKLLTIKSLKKARSTYLRGIQRETTNGFLHCFFDLHTTQTYRSSSSSVNWQNMPIRKPEMGKLIRQCFIPRSPKRHIVEVDYSGIEVHGAAWYHHDPVMMKYLNNKKMDMHRDMAQQCYILPKHEMKPKDKADAKRIKDIRFCGKSCFVFPAFYGDWWLSIAPNMWAHINQMKLKTRDGLSLKKHLRSEGVTKLGVANIDVKQTNDTFLKHIQNVEYDFWNRRFKVYKKWKDNWYADYRKNGSFQTLTGFEIGGVLKRNEVINYPVQGVAFHCLLWSLIRIQKLLTKYKMKTLIVGQIHDSIVADVLDKELQTYLELVNQVMTVDIKKHWKWIITPIEIEADVAPAGKSWHDKQEYKI